MSDESKKRLYWIIGIAIGVFVVFIWPHTDTWDGDGTINAFPSSDSVKNYRLDATMTVTRHRHGWLHGYDEYSDIVGSWPNGGTLELGDCVVRDKSQETCTDQDGRDYGVEVATYPDPPQDDYDPGDY